MNPRAAHPISLVLTVLNEAASLPALLDSVVAQRRAPAEVVVVDGGSTDGTRMVLAAYADRLPLRVLVEPGANISRGRNVAIAAARHELIAVTDGGVVLDPDWLARLVAPFEWEEPPEMVSGFFLPDARGLFEHALAMTTLPAPDEMGRGRFLPSSRSVALTRSLWEGVGGYPEWMGWSEDVLFDLAVLATGAQLAHVPEAIVHFRPRPTLRAFYRQYRNYARGDGQGLLWPRRHAIRYVTYLILLPLALGLTRRAPRPGALLLVVAALAMNRSALQRHWRSGRYRWRALPLIPLIRVTGDVAKMVGFPAGVREGIEWRERTQRYLAGRGRDLTEGVDPL